MSSAQETCYVQNPDGSSAVLVPTGESKRDKVVILPAMPLMASPFPDFDATAREEMGRMNKQDAEDRSVLACVAQVRCWRH
jgi:hypothetical protein